ncbi:hypothetical protein JOF33_000662 [Corynebacterium freneyi]|uniref:Uncharacterized protein n=1 Tax=Corynebacterium freneyi TaxID=134034 RepID=A0ABS4U5N8_9CORY|nr:hypothetical protein [Corynebacterium freneyi]
MVEVEGFADLLALDEEPEVIAGFDGEVDLLALLDADVGGALGDDFARVGDVVPENLIDERDDERRLCGFLGFNDRLQLSNPIGKSEHSLVDRHLIPSGL